MTEPMRVDAPRRYRMRARREAMDATATRIAQATFELHGEIGPARTTISAIAERAGVQRHTVYRHYPDLVSLFRACTAHGLRVTRPPEPDAWKAIPDRFDRLATALREMYAYYHANERLLGNILRDTASIPELEEGGSQFVDYLARVWAAVLEPWEALRSSGAGAPALISAALEFPTWQAMTRRAGLGNDQAAETIVAAVRGLEAQARAGS